MWRALALGAGLAAGEATEAVLGIVWRRVQGSEPPNNPASPKVSWAKALSWSLTIGMSVAVSRLVVERAAAHAWQAATGSLPDELEQTST